MSTGLVWCCIALVAVLCVGPSLASSLNQVASATGPAASREEAAGGRRESTDESSGEAKGRLTELQATGIALTVIGGCGAVVVLPCFILFLVLLVVVGMVTGGSGALVIATVCFPCTICLALLGIGILFIVIDPNAIGDDH